MIGGSIRCDKDTNTIRDLSIAKKTSIKKHIHSSNSELIKGQKLKFAFLLPLTLPLPPLDSLPPLIAQPFHPILKGCAVVDM